jgi:hypothetical protein
MTDARRGSANWKRIRATWQQRRPTECQAERCLLPGVPITYTLPRNRASLDVGHINPAITDPRSTWRIEDTRPEHARCNRSAGVNLGRARAAGQRPARAATPILGEQVETEAWW